MTLKLEVEDVTFEIFERGLYINDAGTAFGEIADSVARDWWIPLKDWSLVPRSGRGSFRTLHADKYKVSALCLDCAVLATTIAGSRYLVAHPIRGLFPFDGALAIRWLATFDGTAVIEGVDSSDYSYFSQAVRAFAERRYTWSERLAPSVEAQIERRFGFNTISSLIASMLFVAPTVFKEWPIPTSP